MRDEAGGRKGWRRGAVGWTETLLYLNCEEGMSGAKTGAGAVGW